MQEIATPPTPDLGDLGDLDVPTPEPLATTLDRMVEFNRRFVHHKHDETHDLIALWIAHAYGMAHWEYTPRLYITAPQPGVGKSLQSKVMGRLSPNSLETATVSGPGLFRAIGRRRPTLFIDEAESQFARNSGRDGAVVNQVINKGYEREGVAIRSEGDKDVAHPVYAALTIVGIDNGTLADTTRSRTIPVQMTPGKGRPERFRGREHDEFADGISWQLSNSAMDWTLIDLDPNEFKDRDNDLWEALYSVAHHAGGDWPDRVRKVSAIHRWPDEVSNSKRMLETVRRYFTETGADKVKSSTLAAYLSADDDLAVISAKGLALKMQGYAVKSKKSNGNYVYRLDDLQQVFAMWLPPLT